MDVCYNKLFKLLIDKGLKRSEFARQAGISAPTLAKPNMIFVNGIPIIQRWERELH